MKRVLSILLVAVLLFTVMPFAVFADESDISEHDELVAKACETFPEYSNKISGHLTPSQVQIQSVSGHSSDVVHSESRYVSDDEVLTYTEYDSGIVTLSEARFNASFTTDSTDVSGSITYVTATLRGTVSNYGCDNVFIAENFVFAIYAHSYDRIISLGNYYVTNGGGIQTAGMAPQIETASYPATAYYRTILYTYGRAFNGMYTFQLRNGVPSVSYENNT